MAIAAAIMVPLIAVRDNSTSSSLRFSSSSIKLSRNLQSFAISASHRSNFRIFSSMSIQAPKKGSATLFLDHRESEILHFVKYLGLGNDFILVDNRDSEEPKITPEQAVKLCDRNFGIGADGVIFALRGINGTDYTMRIFNSDGSEPELHCSISLRDFRLYCGVVSDIVVKDVW